MRLLPQILLTFAGVSLLAFGGANTVVPEIHRQVVDVLGWMDDATFITLFTLAQVAPGPNVLVVSLIGWHMAGLAGLVVATLGMLVPTGVLTIIAARFIARHERSRAVRAFKTGLVPVTIGLLLASGTIMARAADRGWLLVLITVAAAAVTVFSERNPLWAIAGGAVAGCATLLLA